MAKKLKSNNIIKESLSSADEESEGSDDELKHVLNEKKSESNYTLSGKEWNSLNEKQSVNVSTTDIPTKCPRSSSNVTLSDEEMHSIEIGDEAANNNEDLDDDNDDEIDEEKIDSHYDSERLKAFNMFVRLFVDENLDRIVPISKQPKEKIQAIMDACARQFPEFAERTRKRIRTYLKSCRRNKRARDSNGWESSRPTPPHLTSIQAEQILATACENEAQNAKRMRLGLEPVSEAHPLTPQSIVSTSQASENSLNIIDTLNKIDSGINLTSSTHNNSALAQALERPLTDVTPTSIGSNLSAFSAAYPNTTSLAPPVSHMASSMTGYTKASIVSSSTQNQTALHSGVRHDQSSQYNSVSSQTLTNGPTDLSVKNSPPKPTLNPIEVAAIRQLITGYRESAAFLLRSADELENLLVSRQNPT